jgi:hypothetical protein
VINLFDGLHLLTSLANISIIIIILNKIIVFNLVVSWSSISFRKSSFFSKVGDIMAVVATIAKSYFLKTTAVTVS